MFGHGGDVSEWVCVNSTSVVRAKHGRRVLPTLTPKPFLLGGPNFGRAGFQTFASLARQGRCAGTPFEHQWKAGDETFQACAQRPSGVHVATHSGLRQLGAAGLTDLHRQPDQHRSAPHLTER